MSSLLGSAALFLGRKRTAPAASESEVVETPPGQRPPDRVISRIDELPSGVIISGQNGALELPAERRADFALIAAPNNIVVIVASMEAVAKPVLYDVRARVLKAGHHPEVRIATRDIVHLCYENLRSSAIDVAGGETDIEKLIRRIVTDAATAKASDIHIETRGDCADILFRVNGVRSFYANITRATAQGIGNVLYAVHADAGSKEVVWNREDVADSAIEYLLDDGRQLQLRFSSAPIYPAGNFHIVIRVLWMETTITPLSSLGYSSGQRDLLDLASSGSNGMFLVCGPTGSGKSTTLQSLIGRLYGRRGKEIKIITVEDPVEYPIPGACQISVARNRNSQKDDFTGSVFTTFLKGTLRQDPDVVMVGEIRDQESAMVTKDLVLAGRKVFATVHAYSALLAFVRLREIGLPWEILTMPGFMAGILYQRLLPQLCPHCSLKVGSAMGTVERRGTGTAPALLPVDMLHRLAHVVDLVESDIRVRGPGCPKCKQTGVIGRTVVAELVVPDRALLRLLAAKKFIQAEEHWRNTSSAFRGDGGKSGRPATVLQDAIDKMCLGLVSPIDIENQIGLLTADVGIDEEVSESEMPYPRGGR